MPINENSGPSVARKKGLLAHLVPPNNTVQNRSRTKGGTDSERRISLTNRTVEFTASLDSMSSDGSLLEPSFHADRYNIILLLFLYVLQGVPLGISAAMPMLLQNRGSSYVEQAQFSLVQWPFSLKLLWAPILDYLYIPRIGRRKSWLIPTQYLIGFFMMYLSGKVDTWLNNKEAPSIWLITFFFFILNFLAATQDIAVDGWALTMLKRRNVGYSSTCNSVGQTIGYFLGYILFMALESPEFCNNYLLTKPSDKGLVTLPSYLFMWSVIFIISTTLVAIFKREIPSRRSADFDDSSLVTLFTDSSGGSQLSPSNIKESYVILFSIIKLKPVFMLALILLTAKISFAACDGVTHLKLMEAGIPKEKMAIMAVPIVPLQILLPLVISKYTNGRSPMNVYLKAYPYRLVMNVVIAFIVWITPSFIGPHHEIPYYYYALLIIVYCIEQVTVYSMFVATMAFFARISDPSVGGTYMTLLNTLSNLGSSWTTTSALWLVEKLTYKICSISDYNCNNPDSAKICTANNGKCETSLDGYFVETIMCTIIGVLWFCWAYRRILHLQSLGEHSWLRSRRLSRESYSER